MSEHPHSNAPSNAPSDVPSDAHAEVHSGIVLSGTGGVWQVRDERGTLHDASMRGRLKRVRDEGMKLSVGDHVTLDESDGGAWAITDIAPRTSRLARREPGGRPGERVVVANLDQVVVVFAAANPEPHPRMLDRFLIIAEANGLTSRIVINKAELVDTARIEARFADFVAAGYPLHLTSVKTGLGLDVLHAALDGKVSALSGPSGVGKSSLLNTLYPGLNLRVGEISESVNKGRHTTVGAVLHPLPFGGYVADTPGLREVGVWGLRADELDECFPEFRPLIPECRFGDCAHIAEPGCAICEAVSAGTLSAARYDSYLRLRAEIEETERKYAW